uniref:Uncharacterized protein n=1 Tax=Oryza nivara TaxID=4536 RepID=A0A0E0FJC5_ORYNI
MTGWDGNGGQRDDGRGVRERMTSGPAQSKLNACNSQPGRQCLVHNHQDRSRSCLRAGPCARASHFTAPRTGIVYVRTAAPTQGTRQKISVLMTTTNRQQQQRDALTV